MRFVQRLCAQPYFALLHNRATISWFSAVIPLGEPRVKIHLITSQQAVVQLKCAIAGQW